MERLPGDFIRGYTKAIKEDNAMTDYKIKRTQTAFDWDEEVDKLGKTNNDEK